MNAKFPWNDEYNDNGVEYDIDCDADADADADADEHLCVVKHSFKSLFRAAHHTSLFDHLNDYLMHDEEKTFGNFCSWS